MQRLAGDRDIASTTQNIPYPYEDGIAEEWIGTHQEKYENGELVNFGITLRSGKSFIGAIGLRLNHAELGYWVEKP